jgi:hypothetical protein
VGFEPTISVLERAKTVRAYEGEKVKEQLFIIIAGICLAINTLVHRTVTGLLQREREIYCSCFRDFSCTLEPEHTATLFPDGILDTSIISNTFSALQVRLGTESASTQPSIKRRDSFCTYSKTSFMCMKLLRDSSRATTEFTIFSGVIQKYMVWQFNSRNGSGVSLGCWVKQFHEHKLILRHESASELYRHSDRRFSAKLVPTFMDREVSRSQRGLFLRSYSRLSRAKPLFFRSSSSSVVLTTLSGPCSRPNYFSEYLVAPDIEPGTCGTVARNSDH